MILLCCFIVNSNLKKIIIEIVYISIILFGLNIYFIYLNWNNWSIVYFIDIFLHTPPWFRSYRILSRISFSVPLILLIGLIIKKIKEIWIKKKEIYEDNDYIKEKINKRIGER